MSRAFGDFRELFVFEVVVVQPSTLSGVLVYNGAGLLIAYIVNAAYSYQFSFNDVGYLYPWENRL